ncbi:hypothetical protein K469DRAFT_706518 [Zopfia rhizophila CBS 207.26]|uniref:Calcineurin-like phosphoesterase domain-containing protein n=1 Tax=Zopfia rhizophila CBS 207.26 TaxID=1314779 RepID=A0A6A6E3R6_9PEZI|nr:hypothetical protein K469DRAFT_706518 [Zopfia rhizophila CBS 207.26]
MQPSHFLLQVALALLPLSIVSTTWLYFYPLLHGCEFPNPKPSRSGNNATVPSIAPFRLLALGDPQLEGDSSLPDPDKPSFPSVRYLYNDLKYASSWRRRRQFMNDAVRELFAKDMLKWLKAKRKELDLWGNDYYLAHIHRSLRWYTKPTHTTVLGDLLGSQWISDDEFRRRAERYWKRVFRGMERVPDTIMSGIDGNKDEEPTEGTKRGKVEVLGEDKSWEARVTNIAGNHDVGYAGDLSDERVRRFERVFGELNWEIMFELPSSNITSNSEAELQDKIRDPPPALRLVILNSMNLDTPALDEGLQRQTYDFMNHIIATSRPVTDKTHATILLTHIPLHKEAGICVDEPFFDFSDGGGVKEQNMLSQHASRIILEGIFGLSGNKNVPGEGFGRRGIVLNGHDHEGCDVLHYFPREEEDPDCPDCPDKFIDDDSAPLEDVQQESNKQKQEEELKWQALRLPSSPSTPSSPATPHTPLRALNFKNTPHLREITLRSMMGEFGGYAGFLSAWFDDSLGEKGEWRLEFRTCGFGVQHWWWGVHVLDIVTALVFGGGILVKIFELLPGSGKKKAGGKTADAKLNVKEKNSERKEK